MEQQNGGYQSRRVMESNFFQLVPPSAGLEDKKQIIGYLHFQKLDATGADGSATRNDLLSQTETLRTELEEEYTGGVTVDYVFMEVRDASGGKIFDNANVLEARQDDLDKKYLMFGAGGEDSLTGGDAADFLFGERTTTRSLAAKETISSTAETWNWRRGSKTVKIRRTIPHPRELSMPTWILVSLRMALVAQTS
jgi:hypothetical protein